jgi:hypothetical protein
MRSRCENERCKSSEAGIIAALVGDHADEGRLLHRDIASDDVRALDEYVPVPEHAEENHLTERP